MSQSTNCSQLWWNNKKSNEIIAKKMFSDSLDNTDTLLKLLYDLFHDVQNNFEEKILFIELIIEKLDNHTYNLITNFITNLEILSFEEKTLLNIIRNMLLNGLEKDSSIFIDKIITEFSTLIDILFKLINSKDEKYKQDFCALLIDNTNIFINVKNNLLYEIKTIEKFIKKINDIIQKDIEFITEQELNSTNNVINEATPFMYDQEINSSTKSYLMTPKYLTWIENMKIDIIKLKNIVKKNEEIILINNNLIDKIIKVHCKNIMYANTTLKRKFDDIASII